MLCIECASQMMTYVRVFVCDTEINEVPLHLLLLLLE